MTDSTWDQEQLNGQFKTVAADAWQYLKQCRARVADNSSYERLIDEHTARWEANDYFVDRSFTASRSEMLAELRGIRDRNHSPSRVYDLERYRGHWRAAIDSMIARFENRSTYR